MGKELEIFKSEEFGEVRTVQAKDKIYFVGKDIAKALGYNKPTDAVSRHCKGVLKMGIPSNGGIQEMSVISEGDVYRLISRSKLPSAEKFETWVFDEVLPTIRKHGAYMTDEVLEQAITNPDFVIGLLSNLKDEKIKRELAEEENKILKIENSEVTLENRLLNGEVFAWADRSLINALIRAYGSQTTGFGDAWVEFKKTILYKCSININSRITNYLNKTGKKTKPKTLSMITDDEVSDAIKIAITMCREKDIRISDIIKHRCDEVA